MLLSDGVQVSNVEIFLDEVQQSHLRGPKVLGLQLRRHTDQSLRQVLVELSVPLQRPDQDSLVLIFFHNIKLV